MREASRWAERRPAMADDHYVPTWQLQAGEGLVRFLGVPP
jgi:hypothetical protein